MKQELILERLGISDQVEKVANRLMIDFINGYRYGNFQNWAYQAAQDNVLTTTKSLYCQKADSILYVNLFDNTIETIQFEYFMFSNKNDYDLFQFSYPQYFFNEQEKLINISVKIVGDDVSKFDSMIPTIKSIISHELMHAYQVSKHKHTLGKEEYAKAVEGMQFFPPKTLENYVCQLVYNNSLHEIDAQTHNYYNNLKQANPHDLAAAKNIKPYTWIKIFSNMENDIMAQKDGQNVKHALDYIGLTFAKFQEKNAIAKEYRKRKFSRVLSLYFEEKNKLREAILSIHDLQDVEKFEIITEIFKKRFNYILENIS